ncbi:MAG: class II aldolase/adducin family protein [Alicyclobacillus macrosporangiidus]|uniref:class II aldolase/adducin family protein n=1 Tax=Alicyclobacillus macrosporangiidus TaxID=392015 RepID=UPI0026F213AD|nr:class II aldolase/adducin family protein [Alicyclobacillus macrosporangiidus]MCL6598126.1 class II aldolase/adducin family protein [Alicyclobacillus macrosporangiidus]
MRDTCEQPREAIALACRILAMEGLVDGILGHVSLRIPGTDEMWIRCRGPNEEGVAYTQPETVQRVTFDGEGAEEGYHVPNELPIHAELYRARPDVGCVIHAHPPAALVCSIAELEWRPIFGAFNIPAMRMAAEGISVFPHAYLISRRELALPLVETMDQRDICVMKGHGVTVTGRTLEETVVRALNFHTLATITLQAAQTGRRVDSISEEDMRELPDLGRTFNELWVWRFYVRKLAHWEGRSLSRDP